jgi:hypothetical protein
MVQPFGILPPCLLAGKNVDWYTQMWVFPIPTNFLACNTISKCLVESALEFLFKFACADQLCFRNVLGTFPKLQV